MGWGWGATGFCSADMPILCISVPAENCQTDQTAAWIVSHDQPFTQGVILVLVDLLVCLRGEFLGIR